MPLAAEESHDPKRDIPRATIWGLNTLVVFAVLTLFLNTGVGGGAASIGTSATPLFDGFKAVFGEGTGAVVLATIGLIGLIASFFTIIYAYGRNTYSLSRAGYFPQILSITHPKRNTPYVALIAGAVVGFVLVWVMYLLGQSENALAGKIVGTLIYFVIGLLYFAVAGRHKLVLSPEEEFALSQGQYGVNLEQEGDGAMSATEIAAEETPTRSP